MSKVLTISKWLEEAKKEKLLSREGISAYQVEKCKSEFFLLKNQERETVCVLETGRACLKANLKNSILESFPDCSIKFPCYTVTVQGPSAATSAFNVTRIMPRRSFVGVFTPRQFLRWVVGAMYSASKGKI